MDAPELVFLPVIEGSIEDQVVEKCMGYLRQGFLEEHSSKNEDAETTPYARTTHFVALKGKLFYYRVTRVFYGKKEVDILRIAACKAVPLYSSRESWSAIFPSSPQGSSWRLENPSGKNPQELFGDVLDAEFDPNSTSALWEHIYKRVHEDEGEKVEVRWPRFTINED